MKTKMFTLYFTLVCVDFSNTINDTEIEISYDGYVERKLNHIYMQWRNIVSQI